MFHKTPGDPSQGSPSPQGYCPGLPLTSPLHSPAFSSSLHTVPFLPSFCTFHLSSCPSSLLASFSLSVSSLSAWAIVPPSIPVSVWVSACESLLLPASIPLSLSHCLPGSPSQHCSKLALPPFSLLSVCQSLLLSHTHENG